MEIGTNQAMEKYIVEKISKLSELVNKLEERGSSLIEVTGNSGTGKSLLFKNLIQRLESKDNYYHILTPRIFGQNHFKDFVQLITGISDKDFKMILELSKEYKTGQKYDFFYFFSEQLKLRDYARPCIILIDDCNLLDTYTKDFIQYIINYWSDIPLKVVAFTPVSIFTFSDKFTLDFLSQEDIVKLLTVSFPNIKSDFQNEAEIIKNISKGNLYIVNYIVSSLANSKGKLNLSKFIDKNLDSFKIHSTIIDSLTEIQKDILFYIYLLDNHAEHRILKKVFPNQLDKNLELLVESFLIINHKGNYYIHKISSYKEYFDTLQLKNYQPKIDQCVEILQQFNLEPYNLVNYNIITNVHNSDLFTRALEELDYLYDYESKIELLKFLFSKHKKIEKKLEIIKQLGLAHIDLNDNDKAVDYFREYLHICSKHSLPEAEIIFYLASALYNSNSSNFALEIIKQYSPENIDPIWKLKILLLKTEILIESEDFVEANEIIEQVINSAFQIEDKKVQSNILADTKKLSGKLYYFKNDYDKAADLFLDAETYYKKSENHLGLAAVYNNIGVLFQFKGEYDNSEEMYKKSLELERNRYNLKGISVCYNNLGGLMDDKGNRSESIYYLKEALKIQTLLNEPYQITNIYNNLGVTYMDEKNYKHSEDAFRKSLEIAINFNFFRVLIPTYNNLGTLFNAKGDWDKAIEYYQKAIDKCLEYDDFDGLIISYSNLGEIYEKRGEFNIAYDLYFKGLELLPKVTDENIKADLFGNIGSVLTSLHKFKEAYSYLVESLDFFKSVDAKHKIVEGYQKQAMYFVMTHNFESAAYYLNQALAIAEELNLTNELGKSYYLKAILERDDYESAKKYVLKSIELFLSNSKQYDLAQANYLLATILADEQDWEQALEILNNNRKSIKKFGAIKLLEKNDILIANITKEHKAELEGSRNQVELTNKFYEITKDLGTITNFDTLLEESSNKLVEFSEADSAIVCLYNNQAIKDSWQYLKLINIEKSDKYFDVIMDIAKQSYSSANKIDHKQPSFAPIYNHIVAFPLSLRNKSQGVIILMTKHGTHYFPEKTTNMISALCNQIIVLIENIRTSDLERTHAQIRGELIESNPFNIIGKSKKMMEIFDLINRIKDTPTTVLVEGPSGTGKELIARAIHYSSIRRNKQFIAQYCGALPETLLESELFGHVKGSFTGAAYDKKGLFELADGGTFFLDEIADISLSTQAKLLRFLQEGEVKRVGSTKTEKVNVRVVCATNVSLIDKVKKGEFRLDLYYRLNVIRIQVPALTERRDDVPLLAVHFLDKYNKHINKKVSGITDEAMTILKNYEWPGNVRQLENEIERAVTLADNNAFIKADDVSPELIHFTANKTTINLLSRPQSLKDAVEELEIQMINQALEESDWNQTQAAKHLGLSRQGLIKKIKRYNLDRE